MTLFATILSLLLAAAAIVAAVVIYRLSHPKKQLKLFTRSFAILTKRASSMGSDVAVTYRGTAIQDAYIVEVVIANLGRPDVPSSAFDAGKPIKIGLGVRILEEVSTNKAYSIGSDGQSVCLKPQLLKSSKGVSGSFLCEGHPQVEILDSPLIDVSLTAVEGSPTPAFTPSEKRKLRLNMLQVVMSLLVILITVTALILQLAGFDTLFAVG